MDFSRLHTYTPPQCLPENTGYTYALSSSYSSSALDFETENKIDPVFDSPRMSRRSLRLAAARFNKSDDAQNDIPHDSSYFYVLFVFALFPRMLKQCKSTNKQSGSVRHTPRKNLSSSSIFSQSSFNSHASDASMVSTVLDESLIREQTEVDHFWGLDDEGDPKGSDTTPMQGNGDIATAETPTAMINGYTCSDCSMLSDRKEVLTAYSASHVPSSRIYSRDRSQKHASSYFMLHALQTVGATGWLVSQKVLSLLWLAILSPGRAASGMFRLLGTGWYQLVALMSLLKVFLLRRCVSFEKNCFDTINTFDSGRITELEKQMAFVSDRCHHHDEEYSKVMLLLHNLQDQVAQMKNTPPLSSLFSKTDFLALHQEHELRILTLEDLLGKLSAESEDIQKELDIAKAKTVRDNDEHGQLLDKVKKLELELSQMKSELLTGESMKTSCEKIDVIHEKVDAQVRESVKLMLFGDQQEDFPESLLQWLTSNFVSKSDLQTLLRDLELQILKNITLHMSVTNKKLTSEVVTNAVTNAGISGITEAQAQIIVNNALKLYSQDKTGMVDFALESGGGSILSTRCSETYETKTALISLFGIPLWYFSQSPRVVIQPDMYPGNCWAFKGSQGYLVVRLSMKIYPTAFTVEHIPKTLSPTGNITSAPRNFSVYGLDDEYQEEGKLLGQYVYDQGGEPLQMFPEKSENAFQIVELRVFSNWGHAEYTCLYRFRVHGKPAK
uniref:Sad1 and UNC84 domain containing 1 n=1 Tax=Buteo japonicus TaxID=224669 RepID=A0A8C0BB20_9AVES